MNLKAKFMNLFKENIGMTKKFSVGLLSFMIMLSLLAPVVNANDFQPNSDTTKDAEVKANEASNSNAEMPKTIFADKQGDGLEIGPEIIDQPVRQLTIKKPTIDNVFYDATTISGGNVATARVNKKKVIATVHVSLKDSSGTEKANLSVTPKSGKWKVDLPSGIKVAKGDTVTVYQQIGEDKSPEVTANAQPSKASTVTLTMPSGEIWIEQTSSNQVNKDEQAEAIEMLKKANPDIAQDFTSVKFSIDGTDHAYYEVTYTDGSSSGKVETTDLKIKTVTEKSATPTIETVHIADSQIIVTLDKEVPKGTKFYFFKELIEGEDKNFCKDGSCNADKSTKREMTEAVSVNGKKVTFPIEDADLNLESQFSFGIIVKEPHKLRSCAKSKPVIKTPEVAVRDPHKLTDADKDAIDKAIRDANTTIKGVSKLPDGNSGTEYEGIPAVIQIDDSGNVKIFSASDIKGDYDSEFNFVPEKNADGSYKVKDGAEPKGTIQGKDLLKNIKPDAPALALSKDKKKITITPNEKDTDAKIITVSYKDKDGNDQTTTATKADDGTWSIVGEGTVANGVITLHKNKVKGETTVSATVTDKGGIADDDTTPLTSEPGTLTVKETKADKVEALGGLDPVALKKWVGDEVDWKKGVKAKDDEKKDRVEELLKGATFEEVTEEKRTTNKEGDFEGKIKITFDDKSELVVEKQMLYVSNHVTSMERKDKVPTDALDVEFKLGEGTKVDNTGSGAIEGNKENPTSYSKYKVKPNTNLKEYKIPAINASAVDSIKLSAQDGYTDPTWNTNNFVATNKNNVFTATATKTYKVTVVPNGGTGDDKVETKKSGEKYTLPKGDTFTPPENKEFAGWLVGDTTTTTEPGTEITITGDTVIKASWKPIKLKVNFQPGTGASGEMTDVSINKGSDYKLPEPTFTPPTNQEFAGWKVGNEDGVKKAGETIKITDNVTLTATWKDIMVNVSYDANGGSGEMKGKEVKKGSTLELPANGFTAPENQEFDGWKVNGEAKNVGDTIKVNENTIVTAKWKPIMVDVIFDKGEGSGNKDKVSVAKGSEYTLPDSEGFTPPNNQEFAGWEINGEAKKVGDKITVNENTTVIAKYKPIMVDVNFDKGEGSGNKDKVSVAKGSEYTLPDSEGFTPPENQEFAGWEINGEAKKVGDKITVNENTTVIAKYKPIMVDVNFDKGEGSGNKDKVSVAKGSEYTLPDSEGFTPPENQEFAGWKVPGETGVKQAKEKINITDNITLTATWKYIEYKVTFNGNTGTGSMDSATVKKGEKYKLPENCFTAPKNKKFKAWLVDGKEVAPGTEITIEKDTEVNAVWKDIMVKITYDPNGGKWGNISANQIVEVKKGTEITIKEAPVKAGYTFKYWKGSEYQPGQSYTANSDHTFTAVWEENNKPGGSDGNPSQPGSKDKNGTQSRGTSKLNSKNNGTPSTGDKGMNMLYAFGLAFAACGVLVMNRISRQEK